MAESVRDLAEDPDDFIVSAGGSIWFDIVTRELTGPGLNVVLRSGAYLFYDNGLYASRGPQARGVAGAPELRPAIELWAQVLGSVKDSRLLLLSHEGEHRQQHGAKNGQAAPASRGIHPRRPRPTRQRAA